MDELVEKLRGLAATGTPELAAYVASRGNLPPPAGVVAASEAIWRRYLRLIDELVAVEAGPAGNALLLMLAGTLAESPYITVELKAKLTETIAALNDVMGGAIN